MATSTTLDRPVAHSAYDAGAFWRTVVIGFIGFFTLVDLFAAQAIVPSLVVAYGVSPAAMGVAVNASTFGMAAAGLGVALLARRFDRKAGIWVSLVLLAVPTSLLAVAPDLTTFTALRITQGVFMAAAFTLTMAHLAERCSASDSAGALAAYITGVVASNLVGRMVAGAVADHFGLAINFFVFAGLNVAGALLVLATVDRASPASGGDDTVRAAWRSWVIHLRDARLRASFGIGFCILFVFVGTFTYVNFVLAGEPIALSPMYLGLVYLVFVPSMLTTPVAGRAALTLGVRPTLWGSFAVAAAGLPLMLLPSLGWVLLGMTLVGVGTFFAQAATTGFVGRAASVDRSAASGLYLASYYLGGLAGAAILGQLFDRFGWTWCIAGIGATLALAAWLAAALDMRERVRPAFTGAD